MRVLLLAAAMALASPPLGASELEYRCRAFGVRAQQGETLCIPTNKGPRLARCDKVLNVSSWTFLDAACPAPGAPLPASGPDRAPPAQ